MTHHFPEGPHLGSVLTFSTVTQQAAYPEVQPRAQVGAPRNSAAVNPHSRLLSLSSTPRFLEFCKENGGYTGCPFPAKVDLQQGQNLLEDLSKLSASTSGMAGSRGAAEPELAGGKK